MKKKSKLQQKKERPNSSYWMKKADDIFMKQFRGEPCAICGSTEGTVGHHIVPKSRSKALRYDKRNIIVLSPGHHTMGNNMAPHSMNQLAVDRYLKWFKETKPEQYKWTNRNETVSRKYTYKQAYENMLLELDAWALT